jgi:hypothetical protein
MNGVSSSDVSCDYLHYPLCHLRAVSQSGEALGRQTLTYTIPIHYTKGLRVQSLARAPGSRLPHAPEGAMSDRYSQIIV